MLDSLLEIITERGSQNIYKPIDVYFVTNATNAIDKIKVRMTFLAITFFVAR